MARSYQGRHIIARDDTDPWMWPYVSMVALFVAIAVVLGISGIIYMVRDWKSGNCEGWDGEFQGYLISSDLFGIIICLLFCFPKHRLAGGCLVLVALPFFLWGLSMVSWRACDKLRHSDIVWVGVGWVAFQGLGLIKGIHDLVRGKI